MKLGEVTIDYRFRGPPASGNGGYSCGCLAEFIDGPAEVTLRLPPPIERPLSVQSGDGDKVVLFDGDLLVAEAIPSDVDFEVPKPPTFEEALSASERTIDLSQHGLPTCFVCGPDRDHGDGLRLFSGPLDPDDIKWDHELAVAWIPTADLADKDGLVAPEVIWAALDCPTGFTGYGGSYTQTPRLLGRMATTIERQPTAGERCTIVAWAEHEEGRKLFSVSVLYGEDGEPLARARATWIAVDLATVLGV